ncbi:MAG: hypothetical protein ACQERC_09910 [Bacteroidota bacterium]
MHLYSEMKEIGYILCFLLMLTAARAQVADRSCVSFGLTDAETGEILENADLTVESVEGRVVFSGKIAHGEKVCWTNQTEVPLRAQVEIENYSSIDTTLNAADLKSERRKGGRLHVELSFDFSGQFIEGVDINAKREPQVRFGSNRLSVSDYVLISDEEMLLLTYPRRLEKDCELLWIKGEEVLGRRVLMKGAEELVTDYRDNVYLKAEDGIYQLNLSRHIGLRSIDEAQFQGTIAPILDTLEEERVYFSNYNAFYPAFDYFMVDRDDTSYVKVHHLEDELMMEQYRSEYKWADVRTKLWAWDQEAATGIDREVWVGANIFTQTIYYDPPLGDFFLINNELLVFDYYRDHLYFFDAWNCQETDSCTIDFHKDARKSGWEKTVLRDPVRDKLYTAYDDGGFTNIVCIDKRSGETSQPQRLTYRYVEKIKIYDGQIYYIYRPFESPQKKYLYYESIADDLKK